MKVFRNLEEVARARLPDALSQAVTAVMQTLLEAYAECGAPFDPEADGYTVLVERGDTEASVREAIGGYALLDAPFEGAVLERGCFVTCVLLNNQFGVSVVIPDAPWLDPAVRARLMDNL